MSLVAVQDFRYLPIMPSGCLTRKNRYGKQAVMSMLCLVAASEMAWPGLQVDVLVCGVGTGGTITGAGRYMREKNPNIKVHLQIDLQCSEARSY